ncbi:hypothetical protein B0H21DRAFT_752170 [Amylocystis lapponica]|nr:hypothetical protein B0H21DRAFT_752170 [Amylocystis lapponica]
MASSASPLLSRPLPSVPPWKPWSVPIDIMRMKRALCSLLNKMTATNFDAISDAILQWAVAVERTDDAADLEILARWIVQRGIFDELHLELYAKLCQKIVDELQSERGRWRKVDPYSLGNPFRSFEGAVQGLARSEFEHIASEGSARALFALARFMGELLVHGVLAAGDIEGILDVLFAETERNDEDCAVALCRLLSRVVQAPDASRIIDELAVIDGIERVLQEDTISFKTRFLMMSLLERAVELKPHDTFSSAQQRTEVYGLDLNSEEELEEASGASTGEGSSAHGISAEGLQQYCYAQAQSFLLSRNVASAEGTFSALEPQNRHHFVASLIAAALSSNDYADASFVGMLLSLASVHRLSQAEDSIMLGFIAEVVLLEDTVLDIPSAYRLMAVILYACGLGQNAVQDLTMRAIADGSGSADRLLGEYLFLEADTEGALGSQRGESDGSQEFVGDSEGHVSGEVSDFGYAY